MFQVIDATVYAGKPDLRPYGVQPSVLLGGVLWGWKPPTSSLPEYNDVAAAVTGAAPLKRLTILNIENWSMKGTDSEVLDSVTKYNTVLSWSRQVAPELKYGYYSMVPIRDYWRAIEGVNSTNYKAWQTENDRLSALASSVDIIYPSIYTFYPDQAGWVKYAVAQISEARRYAPWRPVYAFLWPQYHDSNATLRYTYLASDYWRLQLQTIRQYADGVVIWGGWDFSANKAAQWDASAQWWIDVVEFVKTLTRPRRMCSSWHRSSS
jgi:hypothetical protein